MLAEQSAPNAFVPVTVPEEPVPLLWVPVPLLWVPLPVCPALVGAQSLRPDATACLQTKPYPIKAQSVSVSQVLEQIDVLAAYAKQCSLSHWSLEVHESPSATFAAT